MPASLSVALAFTILFPAGAQERRPVPKDSVRVFVPGCARGYAFTAGPRAEDQPAGSSVPEGTQLRLAGPKQLMAEIRGQDGSRIEITGLMKRGQVANGGVRVGPGVRMGGGGPPVAGGGGFDTPGVNRIVVDVEGWRPLPGGCPK